MGATCTFNKTKPHENDTPEYVACSRHRAIGNRKTRKNYDVNGRTELEKRFVSFDGEGDGQGKDSRYFLLQDSTGRILQGDSLGIRDVLPWLCLQGVDGKKPIPVWYSAGYDWSMLFRNEKWWLVNRLFVEAKSTWFDGYKVKIVPRKKMTILHDGHAYVHYDTHGFFQSSLLDALAAWELHPATPEKTALDDGCVICLGKRYRERFPPDWYADDMAKIKEYNGKEVEMHEKLMDLLKECVNDANRHLNGSVDLGINRWHGPGALANRLLKACRANAARGTMEDFPWEIDGPNEDDEKNDPARIIGRSIGLYGDHRRLSAYFGGRIEALKRGSYDKVYNYDLTNAYGTAITHLPALSAESGTVWGTREKLTEEELEYYKFGLVEVSWRGEVDNPMGPLPFRLESNSVNPMESTENQVSFPNLRLRGDGYLTGIYHLVEALAALKKNEFADTVDFRLGRAWLIEEAKVHPFKKVEDLLNLRQDWTRKDPVTKKYADYHPGEKILKLAINSTFGKVGQRFGAGENWSFYEPAYAGYITAWTRSQLLRYSKPEETIMFVTDGIYSLSKLDIPPDLLPKTKKWGTWELEEGPIDAILPGIYRFNGQVKCRSFPKLGFRFDEVYEGIKKTGSYEFVDRRFVGMKQSLAQFRAYPKPGFYEIKKKIDWHDGNSKRNPRSWIGDDYSEPVSPIFQGRSKASLSPYDEEENGETDLVEKGVMVDTWQD